MSKRFHLALGVLILAASTSFALGTGGGGSGGTSSGASMSAPPKTALQFYNAGYSASQAGRYDEAVSDFRQAISLKADYAEAYNMLGFSLRKSGNV
ncbi:MAG TPA: tetratricopeptide repeat protein, partial [Rectinemataceae bacterium]|nr:tetratricopeptide repeat protein [Rectinemataceae bacterium]